MAKERYPDKTHAHVATHFNKSLSTIQEWAKRGMPKKKNGRYYHPEIFAWYETEGPGKYKSKLDAADELLAGGDSPNLERYRAAKAALAELELEERKKKIISVQELRTVVLGPCAGFIRRAGERLGKRFGLEALNTINDALSEFDHHVERVLGTNGATPD
jgi:phage terminase Nu1 subunit (DNA packaging protein)